MIYSKKVIEIADFLYKHPDEKTAEVIAVFCGKLRKSKRSVELYLQQAREYNKERLQKQEKAKNEVLVAEAKEVIKNAIANRDESLTKLTEIMRNSKREDSKIRAITTMANMQGWNAPTKSDVNIKQPVLNIKVSEEIKKEIDKL